MEENRMHKHLCYAFVLLHMKYSLLGVCGCLIAGTAKAIVLEHGRPPTPSNKNKERRNARVNRRT